MAFIRFHISCQPDGAELLQFTIKWNDFRLWERATGRSFGELDTAMADALSDVAYFTATNRKLFTGSIDEFLSGDFGFEEEEASAAVVGPTQPDRSTGSSSSSLSPPASASGSGSVSATAPSPPPSRS